MPAISPQQVALGVGAGGALVDVSGYIAGPEGVTYSYGRQDEFRDPNPGQFSFVLENQDGRFTPGNPNTPLATPLSEGTAVCWKLGTRLVAGVVSAIGLANSEEQWGRITVTCGDGTFVAGRTVMQNLAASIALGAQPYFYWPFTDAAGSSQAAELSGNNGPALVRNLDVLDGTMSLTFGATATAPTGDNQLTVQAYGLSQCIGFTYPAGTGPYLQYPTGTLGTWGLWYTPGPNSYLLVQIHTSEALYSVLLQGWTAQVTVQGTSSGTIALPPTTSALYISLAMTFDATNLYGALYANGTSLGHATHYYPGLSASSTLDSVLLYFTPNSGGLANYQTSVAHLTHSAAIIHEEWAAPTSGANRWAALLSCVPSLTSGTVDANLAPVLHDTQNTSGSSAWAALLDLVRTEQGHIYNTTSGSLTAPSTVTNFRARTRAATPKVTFDAQLEVQGVPQFVRDITNLFASVTAAAPNHSATVVDPAAIARVGSASTSETTTLASPVELAMYAQDRLQRGENVSLRIVSVTIDARLTPTDRSADLLGLVPGDRIRISNIPTSAATVLGFSQWDGWFLGAAEAHRPGANATDAFTLYMAPVLPPTGIFDTDRFAAGTTLTLSAAITAVATSMVVASGDGVTGLATSQFPYTVQIGSEQLTVTACTALSGGTQTATVTRGVNGTTAASHGMSTPIELASPPIYAF